MPQRQQLRSVCPISILRSSLKTVGRRLGIAAVLALVLAGLFMLPLAGSIRQTLTPAQSSLATSATRSGTSSSVKSGGTGSAGNATAQAQATADASNGLAATAVLAQDSFQRTNQQFWGRAQDGRTWGGDANSQKAFTIKDDTGQIAASYTETFDALLGSAQTNVSVLLDASVSRFGDGVNLGVLLRWKDAANWYKAQIDGQYLRIVKDVGGHITTLRSVPLRVQAGRVYSLHFQAIGAILFARVWLRGQTEPTQWQIVLTDRDLGSGQAGLRVLTTAGIVMNVYSYVETQAAIGTGT